MGEHFRHWSDFGAEQKSTFSIWKSTETTSMSDNQLLAFLLVQFFAASAIVASLKTHQNDQDRRTEALEKELDKLREK
jgi:hypothetical protein